MITIVSSQDRAPLVPKLRPLRRAGGAFQGSTAGGCQEDAGGAVAVGLHHHQKRLIFLGKIRVEPCKIRDPSSKKTFFFSPLEI